MKKNSIILLLLLSFTFPATTLQASDEKYVLGPGDVIEISVWKDESLKRQLPIPPDGIIAYPLIGDIDVNGMTVTELRLGVTKRLS